MLLLLQILAFDSQTVVIPAMNSLTAGHADQEYRPRAGSYNQRKSLGDKWWWACGSVDPGLRRMNEERERGTESGSLADVLRVNLTTFNAVLFLVIFTPL